jgi:hypothetical protein
MQNTRCARGHVATSSGDGRCSSEKIVTKEKNTAAEEVQSLTQENVVDQRSGGEFLSFRDRGQGKTNGPRSSHKHQSLSLSDVVFLVCNKSEDKSTHSSSHLEH